MQRLKNGELPGQRYSNPGPTLRQQPVTTVNANYSPADVQKFADGSDPWGHPNTDWFADAFKTWSPQSRHNLQISRWY